MAVEFDIIKLIEKGGFLTNVEGHSPEEIYSNVCNLINLPSNISAKELCDELMQREFVLSTAVGQGIAIPHPRRPLIQEDDEQRIVVCFLKNPIDMKAPDSKRVFVMFILLSKSSQFHIKTLSELAKLFRNDKFLKILNSKPSKIDFLSAVKNFNC